MEGRAREVTTEGGGDPEQSHQDEGPRWNRKKEEPECGQ